MIISGNQPVGLGRRAGPDTRLYVFVVFNRDVPPDFFVVPSDRGRPTKGCGVDA